MVVIGVLVAVAIVLLFNIDSQLGELSRRLRAIEREVRRGG